MHASYSLPAPAQMLKCCVNNVPSHAQDPFSEEELQYISNLDIVRDAAHLRSLGIREECVATCTCDRGARAVLKVCFVFQS